MKIIIDDKKYKFKTIFDSTTGFYARTGILDENGKDTGIDPFMASYPHLIDVGVMGNCKHGKTGLCKKAGIGCYQSGLIIEEPNMSVENFRKIAEESKGLCNQFALGGRGDPDQHEHFEEILKICRENYIVPNFTTSGYGFTKELAEICKQYCGAVAVSWYRNEYTMRAINLLLEAGVRTNIHYVLGKNSIDEAIDILKNNKLPKGINAIIFLLHKPVGLGTKENVLSSTDPKVKEFFKEFENTHPFKVGIDSCTVPGVINNCNNISLNSLDTCEGARYSMYISSDMIALPCSFDQSKKYAVDIKNKTIKEAWESEQFEQFRNKMRNSCLTCSKKSLCLGGCPLKPEIVLCNKIERNKGE